MSIELSAKLGEPVSLAELLEDVEHLLPPAARAPMSVVGEPCGPSGVVLGPFPVGHHDRNGRSYQVDVYAGIYDTSTAASPIGHKGSSHVSKA